MISLAYLSSEVLEELVLTRTPTAMLNDLAEMARRPWAEQRPAIFG
jgi:hypothetical protein